MNTLDRDLCAHCGDQFPAGQICSTCAVALSNLKPPIIFPLADEIGSVELLDFMGSDLKVVNAARVSMAKESHELTSRDKRLIHFLMEHEHGSPLEHNVMTLRVKAPIFVLRQWQRHRIASYSEQSGRWTPFDPEFYIPEDANPAVTDGIREWSKEAFTHYHAMLEAGVARERARLVLPPNLYTTMWVTANARSWMNFIHLRFAEDAQWEIQRYGEAVETFFARLWPNLQQAFLNNGRKAP
jgi:thymidylate synthase (FAD)